jgi:hypothetical protein
MERGDSCDIDIIPPIRGWALTDVGIQSGEHRAFFSFPFTYLKQVAGAFIEESETRV